MRRQLESTGQPTLAVSDNHTNALVRQLSDELKPHYESLVEKAHRMETDAYSLAYGRAVAQVAKAHRTTETKAKLLFHDLLQSIMSRVTT